MVGRPKQKTNKKRITMHFDCRERKKKEKTQTIDHQRQSNHDISTRVAVSTMTVPTMIYLYAPLYVEEDMAAHLVI
jgi:hypothetical protein